MTRELARQRVAAAWARVQSLRVGGDLGELRQACAELTAARRELRRWSLRVGQNRKGRANGSL
jgi:predicted metal-dependent hydrolase